MTDVASLVLAVDSTQVKTGVASLDTLTAAGARAEAATLGLGTGVKSASVAAAAMAAEAQASSRAAMGMAAGFNATAGAARLNTIAMRETLVVARELSRGNFTRIPGSLSLLFANTSGGLSGFASSLLNTLGIIKRVQNAELAEEATNAAAAASAVQGAAERAAANIAAADTELALAQASVRVAEGSVAEAAAQAQLAVAHEAVAAASAEAAIAENALAVAEGRAAVAGEAVAASTVTMLGAFAPLIAVVAVVGAIVVSLIKYDEAQKELIATSIGLGNRSRLTADQLAEAGRAAASWTSQSISQSTKAAEAFAVAGVQSQEAVTQLSASVETYAQLTGTKFAQAQKSLADAMKDPVKGAQELHDQLGILDGDQIQQIERLTEMGDKNQAVAILVQAYTDRINEANVAGVEAAGTWGTMTNALSNLWHWLGETNSAILDHIGLLGDMRRAARAAAESEQSLISWQTKLNDMSKGGFDVFKTTPEGQSAARINELRGGMQKLQDALVADTALHGANSDAVGRDRQALDDYSHAINTYLTPVQKKLEADALDVKLAAAKHAHNQQLVKDLTTQKALLEEAGKIESDADARALAAGKGDVAGAKTFQPKVGDHGLATALAELAAQIKGQTALAAAYQVSDSAAIKAEALQKAEEAAIRHKGEIGLFYEKELALAVATRSAEGAKVVADLRYEADTRAAVNGQIQAGLIPASQAGKALELEAKLRPLTAAAAVAEGKAKENLVNIIRQLTDANANNNDEIARTATLQQIASNDDSTAKLRKEIDLIGASNRARAVELAILEAEQKIKNEQTPVDQQKGLIASYVAQANATVDLAQAQNAYNNSLSYAADLLSLINERANQAGQALSDAFGSVGAGIGQAITALTNYAAVQAKVDQEHAAAVKAAGDNAAALAQAEMLYATQSANNQLQAIGGVLGGLKALFKEHSAGYKAMEAAEKAFAIIQAINTIKNVAAGAAKMFATLGPFAFPAVAAMIAVMAGLGFSGGTSTAKAPDIPTNGTGSVLGDNSAQSQSIANSLSIMSKNSTKGLDYSDQMVQSLRKIESNIGDLAGAIARQLQLTGGALDTASLGLGTTKSGSSLLGFLSPVLGVLFGSKTVTKSLYDQGIQFNPATIQQIITQGISGATYNVIETITKKSGFLGIGGSTKTSYSTITGPLDSDISTQTKLIIGDLYKSVVSAAKVLGLDVADALKTFQVQIGQISFKDLKGDEITKALQAVFSKVADQMAGFAVAGLDQFQKAGEGLYETLMRLAKDYLTVDAALKSIGLTFGSVGVASVAAREKLIDLMGGLDQFVSQINFYYDHFLTTAEQTTFLQGQIDAAFTSLGIAEPQSITAFKALVSSLDLTTDAGQATFAALMAIAPAFYQVQTAAQQAADAASAAAAALAKQKTQLQIALLQAEGKATEALALQRQTELAALDASLRGLQQQVYAAQDLAKAKDNLLTAYKSESAAFQSTIDKFRGFAKSLRDFRDSLFAADDAQQSYNQALAKLIQVGSLAAAGDETALGGIQDAAQKFLTIATSNAGSLADVERARALVARYLNQAIGGADNQASIAQQQLDQMTAQVSKLVDIDDHVLTVAEAIQQLNALLSPTSPGTTGGTSTGTGGGGGIPRPVKEHHDKVEKQLDIIAAAVTQGAVSSNKTARVLDRATRGGDSIVVSTDADTPVQTQVVV